jgi:hypothetical protein
VRFPHIVGLQKDCWYLAKLLAFDDEQVDVGTIRCVATRIRVEQKNPPRRTSRRDDSPHRFPNYPGIKHALPRQGHALKKTPSS